MRVVAHRGGRDHGRENDAETIEKVLAFKPDVIEVDVRKSGDGVLYCHHGSIPLGVSAAQVYRFLNFSLVQRLVGKRNTLEEILRVIPTDIIVCLDLKNRDITGEELLPLIEGRPVWLMAHGKRHLARLQEVVGERASYILYKPGIFLRNLPMILGLSSAAHVIVDGKQERVRAYKDLSKARRT